MLLYPETLKYRRFITISNKSAPKRGYSASFFEAERLPFMRTSFYLPVSAADKIRALKPAAGNHTSEIIKYCILKENISIAAGLRSPEVFPVPSENPELKEHIHYYIDRVTADAIAAVMNFYHVETRTAAVFIAVSNTAEELRGISA